MKAAANHAKATVTAAILALIAVLGSQVVNKGKYMKPKQIAYSYRRI